MKKILITSTIAILFLFALPLSAEIKIFLIPRFEFAGADKLSLSDIAVIEAYNADTDQIKKLEIPEDLYEDGFVERGEIFSILEQNGVKDFSIFGSAVKITSKNCTPESKNEVVKNQNDDSTVKSGDNVNLVVKKNGVIIELTGTADVGSCENKEIKIKLKGSKLVKGKLKSGKVVEVEL